MFEREVLGRAGTLKPSAILLLLRHFRAAPAGTYDKAVRALFSQAAFRMVETLSPKDLRVLEHICASYSGTVVHGGRPELHRLCEALACGAREHEPTSEQAVEHQQLELKCPDEPEAHQGKLEKKGQQEMLHQLEEGEEQKESKEQGKEDEQEERDGLKEQEEHEARQEKQVDNYHPPSQCPTRPGSDSHEDSSDRDSDSVSPLTSVPTFPYSIKNTFIDVKDSPVPANPDVEMPMQPLPPPLDIIPATVSPEKLKAFRLDYHRYRAGHCVGAKGEVSDTVE